MDRWIKKYLFISVVTGIYLWISFQLFKSLLYPEPLSGGTDFKCGTVFFTLHVLHFSLAALTGLILSIHFLRKKNYPLWFKVVLLLGTLLLPFLSYTLR